MPTVRVARATVEEWDLLPGDSETREGRCSKLFISLTQNEFFCMFLSNMTRNGLPPHGVYAGPGKGVLEQFIQRFYNAYLRTLLEKCPVNLSLFYILTH